MPTAPQLVLKPYTNSLDSCLSPMPRIRQEEDHVLRSAQAHVNWVFGDSNFSDRQQGIETTRTMPCENEGSLDGTREDDGSSCVAAPMSLYDLTPTWKSTWKSFPASGTARAAQNQKHAASPKPQTQAVPVHLGFRAVDGMSTLSSKFRAVNLQTDKTFIPGHSGALSGMGRGLRKREVLLL